MKCRSSSSNCPNCHKPRRHYSGKMTGLVCQTRRIDVDGRIGLTKEPAVSLVTKHRSLFTDPPFRTTQGCQHSVIRVCPNTSQRGSRQRISIAVCPSFRAPKRKRTWDYRDIYDHIEARTSGNCEVSEPAKCGEVGGAEYWKLCSLE